MPLQKPKSAPSRLRSRFAANRTNAIKEIEAWVKKDADPLSSGHEASRMSGQLTDNITEERMLKSKLWELSKERYKFLSQNAYEKKMFTDRMQRKSSAIKRQMEQQQRNRKYSGCYDDNSDAVSLRSERSSSIGGGKKRTVNARLALLERMDPKNRGDRPKEVKVMAEDSAAAAAGGGRAAPTVRFKSTLVTETGRTYTTTTAASTATVSSTYGTPSLPRVPPPTTTSSSVGAAPVPSPATPYGMVAPALLPNEGNPRHLVLPPRQGSASASRLRVGGGSGAGERGDLERAEPREPSRSAPPLKSPGRSWSAGNKPPGHGAPPPLLQHGAGAGPAVPRGSGWGGRQDAGVQSWARRRSSRYGNIKLHSMTEDPRYFRLESALSPIFRPSHPDRDVHDIVNGITSLHVPPRMPKEAKPKIELKVIDFMRQRGFVF